MEKDPITEYVVKNPVDSLGRAITYAKGYSDISSAMRKGTKVAMKNSLSTAKKIAKPAALITAAADVAELAVSEKSRQEAKQDVEDNAKRNPAIRMTKAFFDPIKTGYGIIAQAKELGDSERGLAKSEASLLEMRRKRGLLTDADKDFRKRGASAAYLAAKQPPPIRLHHKSESKNNIVSPPIYVSK